jgi:hypothetical protein
MLVHPVKPMPLDTAVRWRTRMAAAFALILLAGPPAVPAAEPGERIVEPLAEGVWLLPGRFERSRQPDGNSLLLEGRDGLVVVDSGRHIEHLAALQAWVGERRQPLRAVINTHWHLDHLGGNAALRRFAPGLRAAAPRCATRWRSR